MYGITFVKLLYSKNYSCLSAMIVGETQIKRKAGARAKNTVLELNRVRGEKISYSTTDNLNVRNGRNALS